MTFFELLMIVLAVLTTVIITLKLIQHHFNGQRIFESTMEVMEADIEYFIHYRHLLFFKKVYVVTARGDRQTYIVTNTYYDGTKSVIVNTYSGAIIIHTLNIDNVIGVTTE